MKITLETPRLLLRPLSVDDLASTHAYAGDAEAVRYMMYLPNETPEDTRDFLTRAEAEWAKGSPCFYEFAIMYEGRHVGAVSVYLNASGSEGELGWIIRRDHWGLGLVPEAALAVKEFCLNTLALHKLTACCDARNTASVRVMEKIGMALESDTGTRLNKGSKELSKELVYSLYA